MRFLYTRRATNRFSLFAPFVTTIPIFTVSLVLLAGISHAQPTDRRATEQFSQSVDHFNSGLFAVAADEFYRFRVAYPEHSNFADALYYEAESRLALGEQASAIGLLTEFDEQFPFHPFSFQARLALGQHFLAEGDYSDAIELYLRAEEYALKRNNQRQVGISKLKRALIDITQSNNQQAEMLIQEVELANQIEQLELTQAINFINAKLLLKKGEDDQAFVLLSNLENYYQSDVERKAYYQLVRWSHDYQQIAHPTVDQVIATLTARFDAKSLNNVEILSFAYLENARWATDNANLEQGQKILQLAINHFSLLELTSKISKTFKIAADFYRRHGYSVKADYYLAAHQKLSAGS